MRILITGISGSLGQSVMKTLLQDEENQVIGYSRDELKQSQVPKHKNLTMILGDIRDQRRLIESTRDVDMVLHFAALKRIDAMEENPEECIATNILGTENVLGAQRTNRIPRVVLSSTDKAAYNVNVYGASKLISERLVLRNQNNVVCRYGNVLASRGSVIPMFVESLIKSSTVFITDPNMTRYFISLDDATKFVVNSAFMPSGGLKIPQLKACNIVDLAMCVADLLMILKPNVVITGPRPGEKTHEDMRTEFEGAPMNSEFAPKFSKEELKNLIAPIVTQILGMSDLVHSKTKGFGYYEPLDSSNTRTEVRNAQSK